MGAKKIMTYSRYVLVMILVVYLILVWMYFKDNALQLTSSGLLLWFVVIPLLLFGSIMAIRWWQKRREDKAANMPDSAVEKENIKQPDSYKLFIHSSICLPEGDCWSDVIDNEEDLTSLSEELTDFDGLPMLIKPITRLTDTASLPYRYMHEQSSRTEHIEDLNSLTLRLCSLIHEQLSLSDEVLSSIAEHFRSQYQQNIHEPNSAINIHPDWQQHYLVSGDKENNEESTSTSSDTLLSKLTIYLGIPADADSSLLVAAVKEQLETYSIPESFICITPIITSDIESADDNNNNNNDDGTYDPIQFINEHLMSLSQSTSPELCLLLIADSQINDEWVESQLYSSDNSNVIPTEAGVLLVFCNQSAQDILDIDTNASFVLTEICTPAVKDEDIKNRSTNHSLTNKRSYLNNLTIIKNLLIDNSLSLTPTSKTELQTTKNSTAVIAETPTDESTTKVLLSETSIVMLSDINPSNQPYDMSLFINFIDEFIAQGALVNEHNLGHYMPLNTWLKPFVSLSLLVDLASKDKQEFDSIFLITQHKQCSMLWLADFSQTS